MFGLPENKIGRALSPFRCTHCRKAIGLMERFERINGRNYHVDCLPAGTAAGSTR